MNVMERFQRSFAFNWGVGTIEFGAGKTAELGNIVKGMKANKALVVTDKGLTETGILEKIKAPLGQAGIDYTIFDEVEPNPIDTTAEKGGALAREMQADVIIGVGGGSAIDSAKAISVLATNPGSIRDYQIKSEEDFENLKIYPTPLITVPTTSGTGTEGNFWSIITNTDNWSKMAIGGPPCFPGGPCIAAKVAVDDPLLTVSLPPFQTATTGLDAFAHHYDGYTANVANPISDALSEYSIQLIRDYLPIAYANGTDVQAREMMMLASCLGGISFANSDCSGVHCLGEALGGMYGNPPRPVIPHGLCCTLFMPWMMEYNAMTDPVKHANVARLLGENTQGLSLIEAAKKSVDGIKRLIQTVELPTSLKACGVEEKDLAAIAERAVWNVSMASNPRPLNYDVFLDILKKAYQGW
jgi:alcohol dehydrogenase class IV